MGERESHKYRLGDLTPIWGLDRYADRNPDLSDKKARRRLYALSILNGITIPSSVLLMSATAITGLMGLEYLLRN